jgi:hypothetical protein
VRVQDSGGGTDTSNWQTFTVTITPVNAPPSFTASNPAPVLEDAGPRTINNWAVFTAGPANESSQTATYQTEVLSNAGLFAVAPAVSANGTLVYTPAANANGIATFRVRVQDSGGGTDTSDWQTFTVTVTAVNDAPTVDASHPPSDNEDAGPRTVPGFASFSPGPADESGQGVAEYLIDQISNPALFAAPPAVSLTGTLTYTPATNAFGTSTFRLRARDNGGTANGGSDTGAGVVFTITLHPVNDAPTLTVATPPAVSEDSGPNAVPGFAASVVGPANEAGQAVTYETEVQTNPALFAAFPAVTPNGTLTYTLAADANGTAAFRVRARDNGGASGGIDTSAWQTVTLTVNPVNDAPVVPPMTLYLTAISRLNANPPGRPVSALLPSATDIDGNALGVAVVGTSGLGTWQYLLPGGPWRNFGPAASAAARLLRPTDVVRFVPRNTFNGVATLTYRAWDQTAGAAGGAANLAAPTSVGGATAFSAATRAGRVLVNNAPGLNPAPRALPAILEDRVLPPQRVGNLILNRVADADPNARKGLAVRGATGNGAWQYLLAGTRAWAPLGAVSDAGSRLLRDADLVRFVPAANWFGVATLSYRAWDRTLGGAGGLLNLQETGAGGGWAVSAAVAAATLVVRPVNDAPVVPATPVTLPPVPRFATSPAGLAVGLLLDGVTDADPGARRGVALIGSSGGGTWQYSTNGGATWLNLGAATATKARLLRDSDLVRFVPNGSFVGNATLAFQAWDGTTGLPGAVENLARAGAIGGATAFSLGARTALLPVTD